MVFVEERKKGKRIQYYLVKTFREKGKVKKKSIFLGTDLDSTQLEKLKEDATIELGEIDFGKVLNKKEIEEFEEIKNKLNKEIESFAPESFYQHFLTEYTYDSNAIEGSSLTLEETNNVLFEEISPKNKPLKHVQEAKNHKKAYDYVMGLEEEKLSQDLICEIQKTVVENTLSEHLKKFEGKLRGVNVRVGLHIAPPYYSVPRKLGSLIKWFNANYKKYNPIVIAAYFHSEFENIHPFVDGNGRTGRLLMNFMLKNAGFPPITIFFKYRQEYYNSLEKARKEK
ncbi:Fic family protein, partial [Candidatus Micrarchaeota archaeon]|nr:Fic family protein [Candidatus Micrarchaeota archaeon]